MRRAIIGRRKALSRARVNACRFMHFSRAIPAVTQSREINLAKLVAVRNAAPVNISWAALFVRAMVLVADRWPPLRQCYMRWPWPHVFQSDESVIMVAVQRKFRDEDWLFFGRFRSPHTNSLSTIENRMNKYRNGPVEKVFQVQLNQGALPWLVNWAMAGFAYYIDAERRARHFGTIGLTTVGSRGSTIDTPPVINAATFSYGPIDAEGCCRLTVSYDHRLLDGAPIAEMLADMESTLRGPVCAELAATPAAARVNDGVQLPLSVS
jgi:pyruvate/2-oxoglutarate dehydrogenase complex dihydrolipoamide acyltransferase (E2) component